MDLRDFAEDAALEYLDVAALSVGAVAVVAHLRDYAASLRNLAEPLGLEEGAHERLLHVDVQAALHGGYGGGGVHVVGGGDDHGVEVLLLVEHVAPVAVAAGLRTTRGDLLRGGV